MQKLKDEIKQKIIEVGKKRFKLDGYSNTSMKDIASDAGISTGNIYRYFLTKKHILNEILNELELEMNEIINYVPTNITEESLHEYFNMLINKTIEISQNNADTLKIMFNSESESQYINFKEKVLKSLVIKMTNIAKQIKKGEIDLIICEAIARAEFEGFNYIVKANLDNIEMLRRNLEIYEKLMIENLTDRVKKLGD